MDNSVQQLRDLLRLAATLRAFAAEACSADYSEKLLSAAIELELRADFLAGHSSERPPERDRRLHKSIDIRI
ncbi:MAG TPA: hypothetical protein VGI89_06015 [Rhizomicrobium sp.]|jgi:hypothetical protein